MNAFRLWFELLLRRHGSVVLAPPLLTLALLAILARPAPPPPATSAGNERLQGQRLQSFRQRLVAPEALPARLRAVLDEAERHGLVVGRVGYGNTPDPAGRYTVSRMELPLRGRYPDLRHFVEALLAAEPAVAVESVTLRREGLAGEELAAQVKLAFHVQGVRP